MISSRAQPSRPVVSESRAERMALLANLLRKHGPMTRSQLSVLSGLAKSSIAELVSDMVDDEKVLLRGHDQSGRGRGRPAETVVLNPAAGAAIGLDFGFRHVRAVIADVSHTVLASDETKLEVDYTPEAGLAAAASLVRALIESTGTRAERLLGLAAGIPGPIDAWTGLVTRSSMVPKWVDVPVSTELERTTGFPVTIDNDANLAAYGERLWGAARGYDNVLYFKLHSGVGGALIINGSIAGGARGGAGEFGHMIVNPDGPLCRCGNRGCLEVYAGIPAVLSAAEVRGSNRPTLSSLLRLAEEGDRASQRVIADAAMRVGAGAAILCNAINPDAIIVGGSLSAAGQPLLAEIRRAIDVGALPINGGVIVSAGELGKQATALGAVGRVLAQAPLAGL